MLTISCSNCYALVDLKAAIEAARRCERQQIVAGDGCFRCGPHYRAARHAKTQRERVQAVGRGGKIIVVAPGDIDELEQLQMLSQAEAVEVAQRAAAALPSHANGPNAPGKIQHNQAE